jgi:hypothetical protein
VQRSHSLPFLADHRGVPRPGPRAMTQIYGWVTWSAYHSRAST